MRKIEAVCNLPGRGMFTVEFQAFNDYVLRRLAFTNALHRLGYRVANVAFQFHSVITMETEHGEISATFVDIT